MEISEIQSELTRIWGSLKGTNKTRACLFNLILFTRKNVRTAYVREITQKVIERFPSRVIFITIDNELAEDHLKASASVMTGAKGEYDVACDLIEIEATTSSQKRIPFAILPHILPDLPVYLLWTEDPSRENPLIHELGKLATRMIFDSECANDLKKFTQTLLKSQKEFGCDIADLNWARTENWRELLTSTFYSPERLLQLKRAKSIRITYNNYETTFFCHTQIQAIYLKTWLTAQLQWNVEPLISPSSDPNLLLPPGAVMAVDVETWQGEKFSLSCDLKHPHQIDLILSTPEKCDIPSKYIFTKSQSGLSLVNEICHSGTSEHFFKVLSCL